MQGVVFKSYNVFKDGHVTKAILDIIGWSIFSYIAFGINKNSIFISAGLFFYFAYTTFVLAYLRMYILIDLNFIQTRAMKTIENIVNTEIMIKETDRNLYKRRLALLELYMQRLGSIYMNLEKSLEIFNNMKPSTLKKTSLLLRKVVDLKNKKNFLDKKDD